MDIFYRTKDLINFLNIISCIFYFRSLLETNQCSTLILRYKRSSVVINKSVFFLTNKWKANKKEKIIISKTKLKKKC